MYLFEVWVCNFITAAVSFQLLFFPNQQHAHTHGLSHPSTDFRAAVCHTPLAFLNQIIHLPLQ